MRLLSTSWAWISRGWIISACAAVLGGLAANGAVAQEQPQSETPLYTTTESAGLNKDYGLPSFGMPGAELPRQKATAIEKDAPGIPDFFQNSPVVALPRPGSPGSPDPNMETSLYTTPQGSTTGDTGSSAANTGSSTLDAPLSTGDSTLSTGNATLPAGGTASDDTASSDGAAR
jgi:hypothetical protein